MSDNTEKVGFGYVDDTSDDLKSKGGGKFGLNTPCFLTKFELNKNAGKDGALADAIDITVQVVDREYNTRIYPITRVYKGDGTEMETTDAKYVAAYNLEWSQKNAVIVHILKCFRTDAEVKQALSTPFATFAEFAEVASGLIPADAKDVPLDLFLEWQWSINENQDRTFLQLPKNMKGGYWICKAVTPNGSWKEIKGEKGMKYMDANNAEHPFRRDSNFMGNNKANQQIEGEEGAEDALNSAANSSDGTW